MKKPKSWWKQLKEPPEEQVKNPNHEHKSYKEIEIAPQHACFLEIRTGISALWKPALYIDNWKVKSTRDSEFLSSFQKHKLTLEVDV